jgi:predicted DNA-binding transcriptional regulator AlpA
MTDKPASKSQLETFFNVTDRGLPAVLRELQIRPIGGQVQWPVIWKALGLAGTQDPAHHDDLKQPLMTAKDFAAFCGVSPRTIYRWQKGEGLPDDLQPLPKAIDLSDGRNDARKTRWRKAEIKAWQNREPQPAYARAAPTFGSLNPTP